MECIIFIGIQATGKSTFYKGCFFKTHMRINLDMLNTRSREWEFVQTCFNARTPFVVDNTNASREERARYIPAAKENGFKRIGYYFQSKPLEAIERNQQRPEDERIPEKGIWGTAGRLEQPAYEEGFDKLWYVSIADGGFTVEEWQPD